jgi:hypothetical protein
MDTVNCAAQLGHLDFISALLSLAVYTTVVCFFFYKLNEKAIDKMDSKFTKAMDNMDNKFTKAMQENDKHWREMFMYMNGRLDSKEKNEN